MKTLSINQVSKHFGRQQVLDNLSFKLEANKIYGLLGSNGSGKSTLLNIINDRIFPSQGEVLLGGDEIHDNYQALQQVYLMSEASMYGKRTTVKQMFALADEGYGDFDFELAHRLTHKFGVDEGAQLANLSTGLTTIAKIITALCVNANFIFLDEPTLGLDANHRELFYRELMKTYEKRPRTFVLSSHLIDEVQPLLEHVLIINNHHLICDEELQDLLDKAYAISGPAKAVDDYTAGMKVLDRETIAGIQTSYVVEQLDPQKIIPDNVKIDHISLQKAYIALTMQNTEEV